jgi:hypothetical protein
LNDQTIYVFAYGSLVNTKSLGKTLGRDIGVDQIEPALQMEEGFPHPMENRIPHF